MVRYELETDLGMMHAEFHTRAGTSNFEAADAAQEIADEHKVVVKVWKCYAGARELLATIEPTDAEEVV